MSELKNKINGIKEEIKSLNLGELSELIDGLKKDYKIEETAIVQPVAAAQESKKPEEKGGNVSIKLVEIKEGSNKVLVYKEIVSIIREQKEEVISPIQAKKLVEGEDKIILKDVPRDKAEGEKGIKKRLEDLGATVEIK